MALQLVGYTSNVGTSNYSVSLNGTLTGGIASSPSAGDLVVVVSAFGNNASVAPTITGNNNGTYTYFNTAIHVNDTYDTEFVAGYKVMGATVDTSLSITRTTNTAYGGATVVMVYRGQHATTPIYANTAYTTKTNGAYAVPANVTVVTAGDIVVAMGAGTQPSTGSAFTVPAELTSFNRSVKSDGTTSDIGVWMAGLISTATGSQTISAATGGTSNTSCSGAAHSIGIAQAVVNDYPLTCNSGSYTYTGSSATVTRTTNGGAILQSAYNVNDSGATATTIEATLNGVTAGSTLVAFVGFGDAGTITCSVSDGTSYTAAADGKRRDTYNSQSSQVFYLPNAGSGNHTITATFSTLIAYRRLRVFEIAGLATSTIEDGAAGQVQTNVGTTTDSISSTATGTTSNANDFVLGLTQDTSSVDPGTGTMAAGTGFTLIGTNQILAAEYKNVTSTGTQTATFTDSKNRNRTTHVLVLKTLVTGPTNYSVIAQSGSYTYSGSSATISKNRALSANAGSYIYTGSSIDITKGAALNHRSLTANAGSYIYTGSNLTVSRNRALVASSGNYTYIGSSITIRKNRSLVTTAGNYTYTGSSVSINKNRVLTTQAGSYIIIGSSATILCNRMLVASSGSYTYTGSSITITYTPGIIDYSITALSGSYSISGNSATILKSKHIDASSGSYIVTGQQAVISKNRALNALAGAYYISGGSIVIQRTGIVWPLPEQVLLGIQYGPTGVEYTGTLDTLGIKFDITSSQLIKPISNKVVMTL